MAYYLDTSALVKLVVAEDESTALRLWLTSVERTPITSDLTRTELLRTVRRVDSALAPAARAVLDAVSLMTATTAQFESAALLQPLTLRSLDALHLAAALTLGDDLDGFVTYDTRLAEAASGLAIKVVAPA